VPSHTIDLHVHSNCSDGLFSPSELVQCAANAGVEELSLTDHDTMAGLDDAGRMARQLGILFMPGIELTCRFHGRTVHVLGYDFDPCAASKDTEFASHLERVRQGDYRWAREMCRLTCDSPLIVKMPSGETHRICVRASELSWVRGTIPSPFQIAVVLSQKLRCISNELSIPPRHCQYLFTGRSERTRKEESYWPDVRQRYAGLLARFGLSPGTHWWIPRPDEESLEIGEAIRTIDRIGGVSVLAHPGEQDITRQEIAEVVELGIKGIEVYTFKHSPELVGELEALSAKLGLFTTSGTDFHDHDHRAQVKMGSDRAGRPLKNGLSVSDFHRLTGKTQE